MTSAWLNCKVLPGMFSDESVIQVSVGNLSRSFIVPKSALEPSGSPDRIRVDVFSSSDTRWAILPTDYRDSIPVGEGDLEFA